MSPARLTLRRSRLRNRAHATSALSRQALPLFGVFSYALVKLSVAPAPLRPSSATEVNRIRALVTESDPPPSATRPMPGVMLGLVLASGLVARS
jgi:hypothetical protein